MTRCLLAVWWLGAAIPASAASHEMVPLDHGRMARRLADFVPSRLDSFDRQGQWKRAEHLKPTRALEPLALAHALLAEGRPAAVEQANRFLANTALLEWHRGTYLYLKYRELLSEASRTNMRAILDEMAPGHLDPSWDFVGANDNFPLMTVAGCAFYWAMSGDERYRETAEQRMVAFGEQLTRCGAQSEYSSQAYAFLQIEPMAMLAEFTADDRLRALALQIEERLWFDTLMHVHLPSKKMVGPYSRAYMWDLRGAGLAYAILDIVLGEHFENRDLDGYFDPSEEWIKGRNAASYGVEYHCPQYLVDALLSRTYPFSIRARADGGPGSDNEELELAGLSMQTRTEDEDDHVPEYGAYETRLETYMTEAYTLGSSLIPFHDGAQTENFLAVYRNGPGVRNVATVFCRMVINDRLSLRGPTDGYGEQGIVCKERGRKIVVQDRSKALVSYMPKLGHHRQVTSLRTCVLFPNEKWAAGDPVFEEVWFGEAEGTPRQDLTRDTSRAMCLRDGDVYLGILPLSDAGAMTWENRDGYSILSFYHYRGEPIDFSRRKFSTLGGGFAFVLGSSAEYPSFEAFRSVVMRSEATSRYRTNLHYRKNPVRIVEFRCDGDELKLEYSPAVQSIRYVSVNGRYPEHPRLEVTGFPLDRLPFN